MLNLEEDIILLDLDGVILNSEKQVVRLKDENFNLSWDQFFEQLDWTKLLRESEQINNSVNILTELQKAKRKIQILTKVHTLYEMQAKTIELRNRGIEFPIMFVPPHIQKSQIFVPSRGNILVDDTKKNVIDWNSNGGTGILFDEMYDDEIDAMDEYKRVKSLEFLLR